MKVLGIDPGMAITGWGLLEQSSPERFRTVRYGCFETPARTPLVSRLSHLASALRQLIRTEKPDVAAVEELYFAKNSVSAASVGHGRGVVLLVLSEMGLPVHEYNPRQVKMALTGFGGAEKFQMQGMVRRLLGLKAVPKPDDAADALAVALCHLHTARLTALTAPAAKQAAG